MTLGSSTGPGPPPPDRFSGLWVGLGVSLALTCTQMGNEVVELPKAGLGDKEFEQLAKEGSPPKDDLQKGLWYYKDGLRRPSL